jgi:saccharopine dehydrogenase (NAD+, L-lysine-forming)
MKHRAVGRLSGAVLVYGATGFSGGAIAARLTARGAEVVLGGRDPRRLTSTARRLGAASRTLPLDDPARLERGLAGIGLVVHCAGPFAQTAAPMMQACLRAGVHYLDLAGEWPVFTLAQKLGPAAAAAKVMLMPGVGSTIVVADGLMAKAAAAVPDAQTLRIAGSLPAVASRGTVISALPLVSRRPIVRRRGVIEMAPPGGSPRWFNFGDGERACIGVSAPEIITGEHTTGVPNIEAYLEAPTALRFALGAGALAADIAGIAAMRAAGQLLAATRPPAPSEAHRRSASLAVVVEAEDPWRRMRRFGLRAPDGYSVTVETVDAVVTRVLAGEHPPGFQTPANAYGPGLVDSLACVQPFDANVFAAPDPSLSNGSSAPRFA